MEKPALKEVAEYCGNTEQAALFYYYAIMLRQGNQIRSWDKVHLLSSLATIQNDDSRWRGSNAYTSETQRTFALQSNNWRFYA